MEKVEIKIESLTFAPDYPAEFVSRVEIIILEEKKSWNTVKWLDDHSNSDVDHSNSWYKGNRYSDNKRLLQVILGNIRSSHVRHFRKNGMDYEEASIASNTAALEWAKNCTDNDLRKAANDAIKYSLGADYWYKFEKEWD
jgi:hypothetical protein